MVVVLTAALAAATLGLTIVLYRSLLSASDDLATARLRDVSAQLQLYHPTGLDHSVETSDSRVTALQIIDQQTKLVTASPGSPAVPLIADLPPVGAVHHGLRLAVNSLDDVRVSAVTTDSPHGGPYTIVVAIDQDELEETIELVGVLVGIGAPFIVALAAASTYILIGRSLRSVERIRTRVASMSSADLSSRVPVPHQRDEIAALARTMNDMLGRLQASREAQQRFISDASHELRSPLATITAALELGHTHPELLDDDLIANALLPEAERMRRFTEDLLLLARADEHGLAARRVDIDLDDIVGFNIRRLRTQPELIVTTTIEPVRISGDLDQIHRVVANLLDNASRYAEQTIHIALAHHGGNAIIEIGDDGPGVPTEHRDRIFDRFYRIGDDRSRVTGGTGLGLAIVAEIVASHGGTVRMDESELGGALVVVILPAPSTP
ncbi:sensor histidine kinase [Nocardia rhamnosiphila]